MRKVFNTTVSVKDGTSRNVLRGIVQYDTLNEVNIHLFDGSKAFNYEGYTNIIFRVLKADGTSYVDSEGNHVIATNPPGGIVTVILKGQATAAVGLCQCVVEIYANGEKMTSARLSYEVSDSLGTGEDAASESQYPAFQKLLSDLSKIETDATAAGGYATRAEIAAKTAEMWSKQAREVAGGDFATRSELETVKAGAAPAGYGLGGVSTQLTADDDLNTIFENGWYYWGSSAPANAPKQVGTTGETYVLMRVNSSSPTNVVQEYWSLNYELEIQTRRICRVGVWGALEFVNPPMRLGEEYRTTERFLGKPVYARVVDFGALPNGVQKSIEHGIADIDVLCHFIAVAEVGNETVIVNNLRSVDQCYATAENIVMNVGENLSAWSKCYCYLKYTKTTDT